MAIESKFIHSDIVVQNSLVGFALMVHAQAGKTLPTVHLCLVSITQQQIIGDMVHDPFDQERFTAEIQQMRRRAPASKFAVLSWSAAQHTTAE